MNERIYIFDTTLRDGQQSPGAGMSFEDNITYAHYADELGIDILEAGFPSASQYDFDIVHTISKVMSEKKSSMTIAGLCQLRKEQVIRTMEALAPSLSISKARLHTYVPVDPNLMKASLGQLAQNHAQIIVDVYDLVRMAANSGFEVEFSPEGYSRLCENFDFTTDVIRAAISAGATVINCPDTIGGASRFEGKMFFVEHIKQHAAMMKKEFPEKKIIWSVHCHNDLGLALENSMTAVFDGPVRQIEGCINGVGERAGNVALEQCIMMIEQFGKKVNPNTPFVTHIQFNHLKKISNFIDERMLTRQPHWPITGQNAARHSSGGHTNAILKNPMVYQPFNPQQVGQEISFAFGPLSGSNHASEILENHGFHCPRNEKSTVTQSIKDQFANRRKGITDEEVIEGFREHYSPIKVTQIDYSKDQAGNSTLHLQGKFFSEKEMNLKTYGKNSALAALDQAVKKYFPAIEIIDYHSNSCGENSVNALCQATITVCVKQSDQYIGKAIDADINIAAIKAYINAINQAYVNSYYKTIKKEAHCA